MRLLSNFENEIYRKSVHGLRIVHQITCTQTSLIRLMRRNLTKMQNYKINKLIIKRDYQKRGVHSGRAMHIQYILLDTMYVQSKLRYGHNLWYTGRKVLAKLMVFTFSQASHLIALQISVKR